MGQLAPVLEEPINEEEEAKRSRGSKRNLSWRKWLLKNLPSVLLLSPKTKSNLKILLSVLACPLSPIPVPPSLPLDVSSKAQYIIHQFRATSGSGKMEATVKSFYASGKVVVAMSSAVAEEHGHAILPSSSSSSSSSGSSRSGSFVLWQMAPGMWLVELAVDGCQIAAGSDGKMAWRHTPWLDSHAAAGGARPLRRALQGLDPSTIAAVFSPAQYTGEKRIDDEDCFALKLEAEPSALSARSDSAAEIIKHRMVGYFSQRSGLLVHLEDSQLTRIQALGAQPTYWETNMASRIGDYRAVDGGGVTVAHSGRSVVNLVRFGERVKEHHETTRMEEEWTIDDVVFNVPGLSMDCFIPPQEVQRDCSQKLEPKF